MQIYTGLLSRIGRLPQTWHNNVILLIKNELEDSHDCSDAALTKLAAGVDATLSRRNNFLSLQ